MRIRHWFAVAAVSVATVLLVLAPSKQRLRSEEIDWRDPMWDVYDEIASGPAD